MEGDVSFLEVHGSSILNVWRGSISFVDFFDSASGIFSGGEISHAKAYGTSTISVTGGELSHANFYDLARGTILAGNVSHVTAHGSSVVDVFGGKFQTANSKGSGILRFRGGQVLNIVTGTLFPFDRSMPDGTTNLYGGIITGSLYVYPGGVLNIFGTALKISRDRAEDRVVGHLVNGPIDAPLTVLEGGRVNFIIVPEPGTMILTTIGTLGVLASTCRGNARQRGGKASAEKI